MWRCDVVESLQTEAFLETSVVLHVEWTRIALVVKPILAGFASDASFGDGIQILA